MPIAINGTGTISGVSAGGLTSASNGRILQVVSTTKTDVTTISGSATYLDITGLSAAITPTSASNKILIVVSITYGGSSNVYGVARLMRNSTPICLGTADGFRLQASTTIASADASRPAFTGITFVDSPSTTSATTYKVQALCNTSHTIKINTSNEDENSAVTGVRATSTITVMEIAA